MVEVGEALVLLADGRRGGGAQDVREGAPGGAVLGQQPRLLALQEGRQGLSEGGEEGSQGVRQEKRWGRLKSCSRCPPALLSNRAARGANETKVNPTKWSAGCGGTVLLLCL